MKRNRETKDREPSVTKNDWPLTTKEQILEEAFKIPWTFPFIIEIETKNSSL